MLFPIKIKNKLDKEYIFKNLKSTNDKIRLNALNKIRIGNVFKTGKCYSKCYEIAIHQL